jgi:hypothetical protein
VNNFFFPIVVQIFKPKKEKKRLVMACAFECFQSHCHILKELYNFFLRMMGAITIFEENNTFIFSFVVLGLVTKSVGLGAHLRR